MKLIVEGKGLIWNRGLDKVYRDAVESARQQVYKVGEVYCYASDGHYFYFDEYGIGNHLNVKEYQYWVGDDMELAYEFKGGKWCMVLEEQKSGADLLEEQIQLLEEEMSRKRHELDQMASEVSKIKRTIKALDSDYHAVVRKGVEKYSDVVFTGDLKGVYANRILAKSVLVSDRDLLHGYHMVKLTKEEKDKFLKSIRHEKK